MSDLHVRTRSGGQATIQPQSLDKLRKNFSGRTLTAESATYDEARSVWNAMIDRRPALILQCSNDNDVIEAVRLARELSAVVSVKGGGHNIAGNATCDAGVMIDLSLMKAVTVNESKRTAQVQAGATLGDFDTEAQKSVLATPIGINSTTGVAGLTLGGGFGWLSRKYGLTIDNLISADVVTAAGERVRASATENPDLFWALRGGGGNFGIVTSFEFQLHPVGPEVLSGMVIHPLEAAPEVLRAYREKAAAAPDEMACWFVMRKAPPLPFLPPEWHGREILALAMCYAGDLAAGESAAKPFRSIGKPIADVVAPHPYTGWQTALDPLLTPGKRNYWKSHFFHELSDGLIDVLLDHARRLPDPETEIAFVQLGGAISRVPQGATAYTARDAKYTINVHGRWSEPSRDEECISWARHLFQAAAPYASAGVYVNFLTQDEGERVRAAYGPNYDRLVTIKNTWDPTNMFCLNQNIRPTA